MSLNWDKINEARQGYIDKRNKENEEIALEKGLTEEQISAIENICRLRHEIHTTSWEDVYNSESPEHDTVDDALIAIWYENGEVQPEYYGKARNKIDNGFVFGKDGYFPINTIDDLALNLWIEHVSDVNSAIIEEINDKIEKWLRAIDKQYETHYAPTGNQRLY